MLSITGQRALVSIEILTKARWPVMESIYLAMIPSDVVSLHIIMRASWPGLKVFKFRSDGFVLPALRYSYNCACFPCNGKFLCSVCSNNFHRVGACPS